MKKKSDKSTHYGNYSNNAAQTSAVNTQKASFAVVEAYKTIRTNLLFLLAQNDGKVICLSSSGANEGKSTTAVNVAITFSQLGGKVLLIDGDLRRSSIHKKLKIENKDGLSNVLVGFSKMEEAVTHISESLDVMTAGPLPPNPSELLGSKHFSEFVENARNVYDYIIIDTPPINVVSDALIIAPTTDGLVLVVRDSVTPCDALRHVIDAAEFANISILGTIMNGVDAKKNRRYSYRRYRYGYRNYYGYGYKRKGGYGYGHSYSHGYGYGYGGYDRTSRPKETTSSKKHS